MRSCVTLLSKLCSHLVSPPTVWKSLSLFSWSVALAPAPPGSLVPSRRNSAFVPRSFQVRRGDLRTSSWTRCPGRWSAWGHGGETPSPLPSEPPCHIKTYNTLHLSPTSHSSTAPHRPPLPLHPPPCRGAPLSSPSFLAPCFCSSQARLSLTSEFHGTPRSRSEECSD